ncbi:MAG: thioredoxin TrxC [Vicinamibacterales bacterium]|nr:thioredoxin TrxC [Vicinamibacterales bacterium]
MGNLQLDPRGVRTACPACGRTNRLVYASLDREVRCGQCGTPLPSPGTPVEVPSEETFDAVLQTTPLPVVIDFWAPWCGPCRAVAPELEKVAQRQAGRWLVLKVNTEALGELGQRFRIQSIPTMAVFSAGRELTRASGARPADAIEAFVRDALGGVH